MASVTIGNSVKSIGYQAFFYCTSLKSITFPNSVIEIGIGVCQYCSKLTAVTIPKSVTSIGKDAFRNCTKLTDVYCYAKQVPATGDYAFSGPVRGTLHVPESSIGSYKAIAPWSTFQYFAALPDESEPEILRGDANGDGEIGMPDVMFIVNYILNGKFPDEE